LFHARRVHGWCRWVLLSPPMRSTTTFKCLHCNEERRSDPRKGGRQRYCSKPECQRASKAASQRRWLSRPENRDYFRGAENCERVRLWRLEHPGYRGNKKSAPKSVLQEMITSQPVENVRVASSVPPTALQDVCLSQPALLVGLVSVLTGYALQDDLATCIRLFMARGQDILGSHTALGSVNAAQRVHDTSDTQIASRGDSGRIGGLPDTSNRH
jgi:hypothetical protein